MRLLLPLFILLLLSACSTRQTSDLLAGSTAQRLVTYSVEKLIDELDEDSLKAIKNKKVFLETHFVRKHAMVNYADRLLRLKLQAQYKVEWVDLREEAEMEMDFFFTSMGTDFDTFGFSIPLIDTSGSGADSQIDLLSVNMFHGISEAYFYLKDKSDNSLKRSGRTLARIRTDSIGTPIITLPVNQLD